MPSYYLALLLLLPPFVYGVAVAGIIPLDQFVLATLTVPALMQAWLPTVSFSWNGPAWSLSVEVFFYALFPALLCRTRMMSHREFLTLAAVAVIASAAARFYLPQSLAVEDSQNWRYFFHYFPLFHLPSFLFGMALGRIYLFRPAPTERVNTLVFLASVIVLSLLLGYRFALPSWLLTDAVLVPLYGLVIFSGARLGGSLRGVFIHPLLVLLGHASYSIYILHIGIVFWWQWVAQRILGTSLSPTIELAILLILVIAVSVCVFLYFERPLRRWIVLSSSRFSRIRTVQA